MAPFNASPSELSIMDKVVGKLRTLGMFTYTKWNYIFVAPPLTAKKEEIDEGLERIKVSIPFVASCDLRLNEPRYASLPNIMKAKKKPIDTKEASSLGINIEPRIEQIKIEEPPVRQKGIMVNDVAELVQKLKHEAKVI